MSLPAAGSGPSRLESTSPELCSPEAVRERRRAEKSARHPSLWARSRPYVQLSTPPPTTSPCPQRPSAASPARAYRPPCPSALPSSPGGRPCVSPSPGPPPSPLPSAVPHTTRTKKRRSRSSRQGTHPPSMALLSRMRRRRNAAPPGLMPADDGRNLAHMHASEHAAAFARLQSWSCLRSVFTATRCCCCSCSCVIC